jgi:hypothetical protein
MRKLSVMIDPTKIPGLESYKTQLKDIPDAGHDAEAVALLAHELRLAKAMVDSPQGANALGVLKLERGANAGMQSPISPWIDMSVTERLALADAIGARRAIFTPLRSAAAVEGPVQAPKVTPIGAMKMPEKMRALLAITYEIAGGRTDVRVLRDKELDEKMTAAGLDPKEGEPILRRMEGERWIEKLANRWYQLSAEGASLAEGESDDEGGDLGCP